MFLNIFLTILIGMVALMLAWLAVRAARGGRGWTRWGGAIAAGLPALLLLVVTGVLVRGLLLSYLPQSVPVPEITLPTDAATVARGEHIARTTCAACHNSAGELPLSGGNNLSDDAGLPLGDLYPPNLTPAGEVAGWSDGEILRAVRDGIHRSNRRLFGMPTDELRNLSDEDALAVIAYLRSQPAVEESRPEASPSLLAIAFVGVGLVDVTNDPVIGPVVAPERAPTAAYGEYLVSYRDCYVCHGAALDGVVSPPFPPGPPLFQVRGWTAEQFISTLRTGVNPGGHELQPPMPWKTYGQMDDVELTAVYEFLKAFPMPGEAPVAGQ